MKLKLSQIAHITAGHAFRGAIPERSDGNGYAIQIRDIDEDGQVDWDGIVRTDISGRKTPDWLQKGNIIFAARGPRNLASYIPALDRPVVCAPHFFRITLEPNDQVHPGFIAWQLNQGPVQRYFRQSAEGSAQVSIRRTLLEQTPLTLPPLEQQITVTKLAKKALQEKLLLTQLIKNRHRQLDAVTQNLLK